MPESQVVECTRVGEGRVAVVSFVSPPDSLLNARDAHRLCAALQELQADDQVRAIVLTGQGRRFIRHADVAEIATAARSLRQGRVSPDDLLDSSFHQLVATLDASDKPVIAAINGDCMGGGLEVALACTARIAGRDVEHIGLPEIRVGIFPGAGGTRRLSRVMSAHRARLFILRGEVVAAPQALALGLVDELADDAVNAALALAEELANRSPAAIGAIMQLCSLSGIDTGTEEEQGCFLRLLRDCPESLDRLEGFLGRGEMLEQLR